MLIFSAVQRRALFLSKLQSPSISIRYLPSQDSSRFSRDIPLFSSLSLASIRPWLCLMRCLKILWVESDLYSVEPWVEQVDFRLPKDMQSKTISKSTVNISRSKPSKPAKPIPSLEQITARLSSHKQVPARPTRSPMRLPAFLQSHKKEPPRAPIPVDVVVSPPMKPRPTFSIGVGRLKMPLRSESSPPPQSSNGSALSSIVIPSSAHGLQ